MTGAGPASAPAIAVDAGQSEIRAALVAGPRTLAAATAPGVARLGAAAAAEEVAGQLLAAIRGLGPLPSARPPAAIGLSGYEAAADGELAAIASTLAVATGVTRTVLATDGLPALLGAVGAGDGVVVAAGTGTTCLGRRGDRFAKVDGWGALLGDAGSGFWVGRAGLDQALRRFDGRGGAGALLDAAERRFGAPGALADRIARDARPVRAVAAFARDVTALAEAGDEPAVAILDAAGEALADTACAALERLFPGRRAGGCLARRQPARRLRTGPRRVRARRRRAAPGRGGPPAAG